MHRPKSTVIYTHGGGRFGNQLLRFLHWIAWAREQGDSVAVADLPFWPYGPLFKTWSDYPGCVYPPQRGWLDFWARMRHWMPDWVLFHGEWRVQQWVAWVARYWCTADVGTLALKPEERIDLDHPTFQECLRDKRWLVCSGWQFATWNLLEKHAAHVRTLFQPEIRFAQVAQNFLAALRQRHEVLAGLFIRRGDYRAWANGRFYYPFESYVRWARELIELHPDRRVAVVVASDEAIPCGVFGDLPVFLTTGCVGDAGHWFESFLELAGCDLVASAPSTFAAGAAFLSNRPWWPLRSPEQTLSRSQIFHDHLFDAAKDPDFSVAIK